MKELDLIIQRSNKDLEVDEIVKGISKKTISKILKWFDGNIYNISKERLKKAIDILSWCYKNRDSLTYLGREERLKRFRNMSSEFDLEVERLFNLYNSVNQIEENRPKIIAFEGIDGSGKTVQINLVENQLIKAGGKVLTKSFPVYESFFGKEVGFLLSGKDENINANKVDAKSMSLWYALDRSKSFEGFNYKSADYLLLNRFTLSSVVYQSIRAPKETRMDLIDWIFELEHSQLNLPAPDLYIVFDLDPDTSKANVLNKGHRDYVGDKADVYEESDVIMKEARDVYKLLANKYDSIKIINCLNQEGKMKTPEEVNSIVMELINDEQFSL